MYFKSEIIGWLSHTSKLTTDSGNRRHFHTINKTVFQRISCVAALEWLTITTSVGRQVVFIRIVFYKWPCRLTWHFLSLTVHMAGNVIPTEKNTCIPRKALSAHIHISITLVIELTFRGHFSISGCWLDTFQPRVVVHLCYTVFGINQYQQHGWRVLILSISIYLTDELELQPILGYLHVHSDAVIMDDKYWIQRTRQVYTISKQIVFVEKSAVSVIRKGRCCRGDLKGGCRKWENWCVPRSILESIGISTV